MKWRVCYQRGLPRLVYHSLHVQTRLFAASTLISHMWRVTMEGGNLAVTPFNVWPVLHDLVIPEFVTEIKNCVRFKWT